MPGGGDANLKVGSECADNSALFILLALVDVVGKYFGRFDKGMKLKESNPAMSLGERRGVTAK